MSYLGKKTLGAATQSLLLVGVLQRLNKLFHFNCRIKVLILQASEVYTFVVNRLTSTFPNVEITLQIYLCLMVTGEKSFSKIKHLKNTHRSTMAQEALNRLGDAFNKFPDIFVQAFKIVVDSWKFTRLLLYILWDDWPVFMISASNEQLQKQLEYTLLKPDCHRWWISKMQLDVRTL